MRNDRLDTLTKRYTAFASFEAFCRIAMVNDYVPTLIDEGQPDVAELADAFDQCQECSECNVRAWRGQNRSCPS